MDELIQLLNECKCKSYRHWINWDNSIFQKETDAHGNVHIMVLPDYKLISKEFWFVKWLVNNNKIDLDMVRGKLWIPCCVWYGSWRIIAVKDVEDYWQILMLLAIQDDPIEFLISILK